jgi:hypothetical protein
VQVQDALFAVGYRASALLARFLVDSLDLAEGWRSLFTPAWDPHEVPAAVGEVVANLLNVQRWLDDGAFWPRVVAATADKLCCAYLERLVGVLDPQRQRTFGFDDDRRARFWGPHQSAALQRDLGAISDALARHFPDATARSLDEVRETLQLFSLPLAAPDDDEDSFAGAVDVMVGMVSPREFAQLPKWE